MRGARGDGRHGPGTRGAGQAAGRLGGRRGWAQETVVSRGGGGLQAEVLAAVAGAVVGC